VTLCACSCFAGTALYSAPWWEDSTKRKEPITTLTHTDRLTIMGTHTELSTMTLSWRKNWYCLGELKKLFYSWRIGEDGVLQEETDFYAYHLTN